MHNHHILITHSHTHTHLYLLSLSSMVMVNSLGVISTGRGLVDETLRETCSVSSNRLSSMIAMLKDTTRVLSLNGTELKEVLIT